MQASGEPDQVDVLFPVAGPSVPAHHAYAAFGAISRVVPELHDEPRFGVFNVVGGTIAGDGVVRLGPRAALRLRLPMARLAASLRLVGRTLELDRHRVTLGPPRVVPLRPAASLGSRLVLVKLQRVTVGHADELTPEHFLEHVNRKLAEPPKLDAAGKNWGGLGCGPAARANVPLHRDGPRAGQPVRRVVRVRDQTHAGFALVIDGLDADESLRVQQLGLGGRRKMGCGLFLPIGGLR